MFFREMLRHLYNKGLISRDSYTEVNPSLAKVKKQVPCNAGDLFFGTPEAEAAGKRAGGTLASGGVPSQEGERLREA